MSYIDVFMTDFGCVELAPGELEALKASANIIQGTYWAKWSDELIGVPEVEWDNTITLRFMERRARNGL